MEDKVTHSLSFDIKIAILGIGIDAIGWAMSGLEPDWRPFWWGFLAVGTLMAMYAVVAIARDLFERWFSKKPEKESDVTPDSDVNLIDHIDSHGRKKLDDEMFNLRILGAHRRSKVLNFPDENETPFGAFKRLVENKRQDIAGEFGEGDHTHDVTRTRDWYHSTHKILTAVDGTRNFVLGGARKQYIVSGGFPKKPILTLFEMRSPLNNEPNGENRLTHQVMVGGQCSICLTITSYILLLRGFLEDVVKSDVDAGFKESDYCS